MRFLPVILAVTALLPACKGGGGELSDEELSTITRSERPDKRSEILAIADEPGNQILFFGGNDGPIVNQNPRPRMHDDTWLFTPGEGWREVAVSGPSARGRYGAAYDAPNRRAFFFGGRWRDENAANESPPQYEYTTYNDLWEFDFETETWTELDAGGDAGSDMPDPRWYPSLAWDETNETLYMWGGSTTTDPLDFEFQVPMDLWRWREGTGWEELSQSGEPDRRTFVASFHDTQRNHLIVFGGQRGDFQSMAYNQLYSLDLDSGAWTELDDGNGPSTRMHSHGWYDSARDRYLVFGGHTDIGDDNDVWQFDPNTGEWDELNHGDTVNGGLGCLGNSSEVPKDFVEIDLTSPERRHRGMFALMHDNMWLFGGMHSECSDHLDDLWRYDLETDTWFELIEARSGESCERRNEDCECLCL